MAIGTTNPYDHDKYDPGIGARDLAHCFEAPKQPFVGDGDAPFL